MARVNMKLKVLKRGEWNPGAVAHLAVLIGLVWHWSPLEAWWWIVVVLTVLGTCAQGRTRVEVSDER